MKYYLLLLYVLIAGIGCSKQASTAITAGAEKPNAVAPVKSRRPASLGVVGDTANVQMPVNGGLVLMGGGTDVAAAFKWMIERSGGGDVVIIRASGTDAYNDFVYQMGNVNSVETLKIDTRALAENDTVANIIRNAEMLFIAGGDQSIYMKLWKGTKTEKALNFLMNEKKAPVGGTSAGCAIMGGFYYSGEQGSVVSNEALADPFGTNITLYNRDFLKAPFLAEVITDQHFLTRSREGRSIVYLARIYHDFKVMPKGIAVDEKTSVCIDREGIATVFGTSKSYFLLPDVNKLPETLLPGKPLTWHQDDQAIAVYEISGSADGHGSFNVANFDATEAKGGKWFWWSTNQGNLVKIEK